MIPEAISSYLLGSVPTAYLLGKWRRGIDIRVHGTENMGSLNSFRVLGPFWGILTFLIDAGKGALAVAIARASGLGEQAVAACGLLAVAGHNWPIFLKFRGGKGAATGIGVILASQAQSLGITVGAMGSLVGLSYLLTRNISFALGLTFVSLPILDAWIWRSRDIVTLSVGVLVLMVSKLGPAFRDYVRASEGNLRRFVRYTVYGVPRDVWRRIEPLKKDGGR